MGERYHDNCMKVKVGILLSLVLLGISLSPVHAMRKGVLGLTSDHLSIPPTVEGPGFLLPDSPLYFLDKMKQQARLFLAFTPQLKAQVYSSVAGERLAELRVELLKNNTQAAEVALTGVRENTKRAALSLDDARLMGNNVEKDAQDLNREIKERLVSLDLLELQSSGEMKAAVAYTTQTMTDAKAVVEDGMRRDLIANEVQDDISREVAKKILGTATTAEELKADLDELQKQATSDAQKALPNRKDALQKTIGQDKSALAVQNAFDMKKQDDKFKLQQQTAAYVNDIVTEAQKAALLYQQSQNGQSANSQ